MVLDYYEMNLPIEYNLMGNVYKNIPNFPWKGIGYPNDDFWKIAAEMKCKAIIGLDSHMADHVQQATDYDEAVEYLSKLGIEQIVDIPMRY